MSNLPERPTRPALFTPKPKPVEAALPATPEEPTLLAAETPVEESSEVVTEEQPSEAVTEESDTVDDEAQGEEPQESPEAALAADEAEEPTEALAPVEEASTAPEAAFSLPVAKPVPVADPSSLPARPTLPAARPNKPALPTQRPNPNRPVPSSVNRQVATTATTNSAYEDGVTFEDLLEKDYDEWFKPLEGEVVELKERLQSILQERNLESKLALAREKRGVLYDEMKAQLHQLLIQLLLSEANGSGYHKKRAHEGDEYRIMSLVTNELIGLGPIEPLWTQPGISEILVNGPENTYIERRGKLVHVPGVKFRSRDHAMEIATQILLPLGRSVDVKRPYENGRLPDGSRVHITHWAVAPDGPYMSIRRFPDKPFSIRLLLDDSPDSPPSMSEEMAVELGNLIAKGCSVLISGGTGTGKTSNLNAFSGAIPRGERILTIEDNLEMQLHPRAHRVALEARRARGDEAAAVTIRDLVREALRMRPDRIVVGEVRDAAGYDMIQAMTTGHDGSMTTIHANDVESAIERLVGFIQQSGEMTDPHGVLALIASGVDLVIQIERFPEDGSRRITAIAEIPTRVTLSESGAPEVKPRMLWQFEQLGLETDENGDDHVTGRWNRVNEVSESLVRRKRLDKQRSMTLEELLVASDIPEKKKPTA